MNFLSVWILSFLYVLPYHPFLRTLKNTVSVKRTYTLLGNLIRNNLVLDNWEATLHKIACRMEFPSPLSPISKHISSERLDLIHPNDDMFTYLEWGNHESGNSRIGERRNGYGINYPNQSISWFFRYWIMDFNVEPT